MKDWGSYRQLRTLTHLKKECDKKLHQQNSNLRGRIWAEASGIAHLFHEDGKVSSHLRLYTAWP